MRDRGRFRKRASGDSSGQTTIEFVLTFFLIIVFFLAFTQMSLIFGFANFVHYATFMAARAELSSGPSSDDQIQRAQAVLGRMLKASGNAGGKDRWPGLGQAFGGSSDVKGADIGNGIQYVAGDPGLSWMQGVRYTFRSRLFMGPLGGGASSSSVTLTSESWLGRETNYSDCSVELTTNGALFDNGC